RPPDRTYEKRRTARSGPTLPMTRTERPGPQKQPRVPNPVHRCATNPSDPEDGSASNGKLSVRGEFRVRECQSWAAASWSSQNTVRSLPRAPATGASSGSPPATPRRTASALDPPETNNHTWRARRREGSVIVTRNGGGLGESRTPTTAASSSCTCGSPGNNDATCASGPTPSKHTSKRGTGPSPRAATANPRE